MNRALLTPRGAIRGSGSGLGSVTDASARADGGWIDRVDFRNGQVLDEDANSSEATVWSAGNSFP